jgi:RecA/RadA recombinase
MMDFKELQKITGNEFLSQASEGVIGGDVTGWLDTGSYALNALVSGSIYGGMPQNKITCLAGEESTGKTFFALHIVKLFLEKNPTGMILYFDSESAVSRDMIEERGINSKRVFVGGVKTVQEFKTQLLRFLDKHDPDNHEPVLVVLDSLGMLSTEKEMNDTAEGKDVVDMTKARLLKATFRTLTLKLGVKNVPLIVTNHVYDEIGLFAKKVMGGGSGAKYAGSTIVFLSKSKEKDGTDQTGVGIRCTNMKSRLTKEGKSVRVVIDFLDGLQRYSGLSDLALKHEIFVKSGNRIELPDGTKVFQKTVDNNPEQYYTDEILQRIDEAVGREFKFGSSLLGKENDNGDDQQAT